MIDDATLDFLINEKVFVPLRINIARPETVTVEAKIISVKLPHPRIELRTLTFQTKSGIVFSYREDWLEFPTPLEILSSIADGQR